MITEQLNLRLDPEGLLCSLSPTLKSSRTFFSTRGRADETKILIPDSLCLFISGIGFLCLKPLDRKFPSYILVAFSMIIANTFSCGNRNFIHLLNKQAFTENILCNEHQCYKEMSAKSPALEE